MPRKTHNDDDLFDRIDRHSGKIVGVGIAAVVLSWIVSLAGLVLVVWVAVHFLSKVW